ncbi:MAG: hypothetical protein ABFD14_11610 [Anaerolineaceae bacterium]
MVHALQSVRKLLVPHGIVIEVHNLPVPPVIEVHSGTSIIKVGWLLDKTDFEVERSAFNALFQVIENGEYLLDDQRDFLFNTQVDDLQEMQSWLDQWWESAILSELTNKKIKAAMDQAGKGSRIVTVIPTRMVKLRVK